MRIGSVGLAPELTFAAMLWILPGLVPAQHMLRGFLDIAALPRISHEDRNLRPASRSKNGDASTSTKHAKGSKSSKSSSKLSSKASKQRKKQVNPTVPIIPPDVDIKADDPCPAGDEDCVVLFSEDYEHPKYDLSVPGNSYEDSRSCLGPEGEPNAFLHWSGGEDLAGVPNYLSTVNRVYEKEGRKYDQDYTVEPVYLKTWSDPDTNEGLKFSDDRGGKYAIGMLSELENDKLRLEFNTNGLRFVSFGLDIAAAANDPCGYTPGQEFPTDPAAFEISAIDKFSMTVLDTMKVTSKSGAPDRLTILWTRVCGSLDVSKAESGNIIFEWDALAPFYVLFDNLDIVASDDPKMLPATC